MFELGCSSVVYRRTGLTEALQRIKSLGFGTVDIGMIDPHFCPHFNPETTSQKEKEELRSLLEKMGLRVSALNVHFVEIERTTEGVQIRPHGFLEDRGKQMKRTKLALDLAEHLEAYAVTIQSAWSVSPEKWLETAKRIAKDFVELASYAKDRGQDLTVENHLNSLLESPKQVGDFLAMVDRQNVGVAFDSAHMAASGADPVKAIGKLKDLVKHVHLKDARDNNIHYTVGDGTIDFSGLFQELRRVGYSRTIALEIEPQGKTFMDVDREARRSKDFLLKFFEARKDRLLSRK